MGEQAEHLKRRVRQFALGVIALIQRLSPAEPGPTVIAEAKLTDTPDLQQLRDEARQLVAIFSASVGTARRNRR